MRASTRRQLREWRWILWFLLIAWWWMPVYWTAKILWFIIRRIAEVIDARP